MSLRFDNVRLIDPETGTDELGSLTLANGVIDPDAKPARVIDGGGKCLAPGIVDIGVKVCEPGERHKESYKSAGLAAAAGGVTTTVTRPDTQPAIDSPETLEFVQRRANEAAPGLPSAPPMAERMGLDRDISLIEMTGVRYHIDQVTTARALPPLRRAKDNGLDITAGVSIHHLTLNELDVADYRTFFKVKPPLRSEDDRLAVIEAVADGTIDLISSMHTPQDEESKRLPFEEAASGAVALETLLPAAMRLVHGGHMDLPTLWRALSLAPAQRLGLPCGRLTAGAPADLVLFDPDAPHVLDRFKLHSKSKNTPFDGARMQGRVLATYVAGTEVYTRS